MKTIKCPICRSQHLRTEYIKAKQAGSLQQLCYRALVDRIDASINECRSLYHDAYKERDQTLMWEMSRTIEKLEQDKINLPKPEPATP